MRIPLNTYAVTFAVLASCSCAAHPWPAARQDVKPATSSVYDLEPQATKAYDDKHYAESIRLFDEAFSRGLNRSEDAYGDMLYVYADAPGQPLKAIYFDNEGHVIYYDVSTPDPTSAVFLSDSSRPGPQFRLVYSLKGSVMSGAFQTRMPGQTEWRSYLEWSGVKN